MNANTPAMPTGTIVLWYGAIADIPAGWVICDGTKDTPNLQNVFVVGAGDTYVVGATGGAINHEHQFIGTGHTHDIGSGSNIAAGSDLSSTSDSEQAVGTTEVCDGRPPYRALAYIMHI